MKNFLKIIFAGTLFLSSSFVFADANLDYLQQQQQKVQQIYLDCLTANNNDTSKCQTEQQQVQDAIEAINGYTTVNLSSDPGNASQNASPQTSTTTLPAGIASNCASNNDPNHPGCNLNTDLKPIWKSVTRIVLTLATFAVVFMIAWTILRLMFLKEEQRVVEINEAKSKLLYAIFGFIIIIVIAGGILVAIYESLGINSDLLNSIKSIMSYLPVSTAYAADNTGMITNPTHIDNIYDLMIAVFQTFVRWILFPAVVFAWFMVGARFVYAKGRPEQLKSARKTFLIVLAGTVTIMILQGLLISLQETFKSFLPPL